MTNLFQPLMYCALFSLCSAMAATADFDTPWQNQSSLLSCSLSQQLNEFGQATFRAEAGTAPMFMVEVRIPFRRDHKAEVVSYPPTWQQNRAMRPVGEWQMFAGPMPLTAQDSAATRLLTDLKDGYNPRFVLLEDEPGHADKISFGLSSARFTKAYDEYSRCVSELVPVTFEQVRKSRVFFGTDTGRLSPETERWLDYVVAYYKETGPFKSIDLEGHSDTIGRFVANRRLSFERVWMVKDYLVYAGVDPTLIRVKGMSSSVPLASNRTAEGRAINRRVEIRIRR